MLRRQVKKVGPPGGELFFFPKSSVGSGREWSVTESSSRQQEQTAIEFADTGASIGTFLAIDYGNPPGSVDSDASILALMTNPSATGTVSGVGTPMVDLKDKKARLMASVGLAEKISAKIDGFPGVVPDRVAAAGATLLLLTEQAELFASELNFVIKYNKDTTGKPVTPSIVDNFAKKAESISCKVLEEVKVIRALTATPQSKP